LWLVRKVNCLQARLLGGGLRKAARSKQKGELDEELNGGPRDETKPTTQCTVVLVHSMILSTTRATVLERAKKKKRAKKELLRLDRRLIPTDTLCSLVERRAPNFSQVQGPIIPLHQVHGFHAALPI
jgi:hypothetical protein